MKYRTGEVRYKLVANNGSDVHNTGIDFVNFSPDGSKLATASRDRIIRLWNAHTGDLIQVLNGHRSHVLSVVFSQDGKTLISSSRDNTRSFVGCGYWRRTSEDGRSYARFT